MMTLILFSFVGTMLPLQKSSFSEKMKLQAHDLYHTTLISTCVIVPGGRSDEVCLLPMAGPNTVMGKPYTVKRMSCPLVKAGLDHRISTKVGVTRRTVTLRGAEGPVKDCRSEWGMGVCVCVGGGGEVCGSK